MIYFISFIILAVVVLAFFKYSKTIEIKKCNCANFEKCNEENCECDETCKCYEDAAVVDDVAGFNEPVIVPEIPAEPIANQLDTILDEADAPAEEEKKIEKIVVPKVKKAEPKKAPIKKKNKKK